MLFRKGSPLKRWRSLCLARIRIEAGMGDSITPRLEQPKKEMGIADRNDIQCIPDLIDFDEGRFPQAGKTS